MLSAKKSPRFEYPFDNQGYCHRHSHVRLAKKKLTGGWKILQDFCAECAEEDEYGENQSDGSRYSRRSRRSANSRRSASSRKSVGSGAKSKRPSYRLDDDDETDSQLSSSRSTQNQKKIVKKMNYTDDDGEEGMYTGYVNSQYKPHGSGKMQYRNGERFSGEWCEGTKVHGKTTLSNYAKSKKKTGRKDKRDRRSKEPSSKVSGSSKNGTIGSVAGSVASMATRPIDNRGNGKLAIPVTPEQDRELNDETKEMPAHEQKKQEALRDYKSLYNTSAHVVKNMLFHDFYGDTGRYTGEVNAQTVPHGIGEITYDHGLVQEGIWTNGVLDEDGSTTSAAKNNAPNREGTAHERKSRRRAKSKDP